MNIINKIFIISLILIMFACNNSPTTIENSSPLVETTPINKQTKEIKNILPKSNPSTSSDIDTDAHTVVVKEALPTSNYVYLRVTEAEEEFWIATAKTDVVLGETYTYKGGLLKTQFESKEHNRIFEKVYLVSSIHPKNGVKEMTKTNTNPVINNNSKVAKNIDITKVIKISEIVSDPISYEGKTIKISGKCTKINLGIMGKNWIHIKDGSKDGYDFIVTSQSKVEVGTEITIKGIITLDKDFGAGYQYDIIMEDGILTK